MTPLPSWLTEHGGHWAKKRLVQVVQAIPDGQEGYEFVEAIRC